MRRCAGLRRDGSPCAATVEEPQQYCWHHDPEHQAERTAFASKAARAKSRPPEIVQIKDAIRKLAEDVVAGRMSPGRGSVASQAYGTLLKALEVERKIRETDALEERLEELEEELAREKRRRFSI